MQPRRNPPRNARNYTLLRFDPSDLKKDQKKLKVEAYEIKVEAHETITRFETEKNIVIDEETQFLNEPEQLQNNILPVGEIMTVTKEDQSVATEKEPVVLEKEPVVVEKEPIFIEKEPVVIENETKSDVNETSTDTLKNEIIANESKIEKIFNAIENKNVEANESKKVEVNESKKVNYNSSHRKKLIEQIKTGDLISLQELYVKYGFNETERNENEESILEIISVAGSSRCLRFYFEKTNKTCLEILQKSFLKTIKSNNTLTFKVFLSLIRDLNFTNEKGETPLMIAAFYGNDFMIRELLSRGVDVDIITKEGQGCVFYALWGKKYEMARYLYDQRKITRYTLLSSCILINDDSMTDYMIKKKQEINDINFDQTTPLMLAISMNKEKTVKELIDAGANLFFKNSRNNTPLYTAIKSSNINIIDYLLSKNILNNTKIYDKYGIMSFVVSKGSYQVVEYFVKNFTNWNVNSPNQKSLFFIACKRGDLEILKLLISHGIDYNETSISKFYNGIHHACMYGNVQIAKYLIELGVEIPPEFVFVNETMISTIKKALE